LGGAVGERGWRMQRRRGRKGSEFARGEGFVRREKRGGGEGYKAGGGWGGGEGGVGEGTIREERTGGWGRGVGGGGR